LISTRQANHHRFQTADGGAGQPLNRIFERYKFTIRFGAAVAGAVDEMDRRRRVGAFALAASTVPETRRRAVIAARLPAAGWPGRDLRIPAVDAVTGEVVIFTRDGGVRLADAVAASCAVPGIWPPASIGGHRYVDGGVCSSTNADPGSRCRSDPAHHPDPG
jgi:NTE family protein